MTMKKSLISLLAATGLLVACGESPAPGASVEQHASHGGTVHPVMHEALKQYEKKI